ncbi:MAG: hypothetical protein ACK452_16165 [Bacteroidota bacterium]|jgi:hypothetical protein
MIVFLRNNNSLERKAKKFRNFYFLFFFLILSFNFSIHAQLLIKNFIAQPANSSQLLVTWTVGAGSATCNDLQLFWSTDSFKTASSWVHTLPGICGLSGADENYYFQHNNPDPNGKNYYRLYSFGSPVSPIIVYDFGADNGSYIMIPHPITAAGGVLTFKNPNNDLWVLDIANANCTVRYIYQNIYNPFVELPGSLFENGIYFFRLYNANGEIIKGKFIVVKD